MVGTVSVNDHTAALAHCYDGRVNAASDQVRADELRGANVGGRMVGNIGRLVKIRNQDISRKIFDRQVTISPAVLLERTGRVENDLFGEGLRTAKSGYNCLLRQSPVNQTNISSRNNLLSAVNVLRK